MAVIKADAYGHGLLRAAEALSRSDGFAMLELDAAIRLREAGYRQTVLLLEGFFSMEELAWIEQYHLSTVIHNREQLAMLSAYRPHGRIGLNIFLKINTGMNRLGFTLEQVPAALEALRAIHAAGEITLMTHFARADECGGKEAITEQLQRFKSPAGLDIQARRGDEIALGIMAEIVQRRRNSAELAWVSAPEAATQPEAAPTTALDPICGLSVAIAGAKHTYEYQGTTYYFCCPGCKTTFRKAPEQYVGVGYMSQPA